MASHPILAWAIVGIAALATLLITLYLLYLLFAIVLHVLGLLEKDRSGAKLAVETLRFEHDEGLDEIRLGWTIVNHGKFAARRLHASIRLRVGQTDGLVASWRQAKSEATLEPGARTDIVLRVTRRELSRLTRNFKDGSLNLWSHHASTPPKKPANFFGTYGPSVRVKLAVGQVAGQDCIAVIDPTPLPGNRFS